MIRPALLKGHLRLPYSPNDSYLPLRRTSLPLRNHATQQLQHLTGHRNPLLGTTRLCFSGSAFRRRGGPIRFDEYDI